MSTELSKGNLFDPVLVTDLINKVKGKSSLAVLSAQQPIPFNGQKEFTFTMDSEIDIVAENGKKTHGGISLAPQTIVPIKFEYGARISDEFMYATDEEKIDILAAFNDGFSKKVARGLDIAAFHGLNPRTKEASAVIGDNNFDSKVTQKVVFADATPDDNLDAAIALVDASENDVTGMAFSKAFGSAMAKVKVNGVVQYPEFRFGGAPTAFAGKSVDLNNTLEFNANKDRAIVGDFTNMFKWGFSKQIPLEIIQYGDPDNSGRDLKGYNQVYLRSEVYLGWGILDPNAFARIEASE